MKGEFSVIGDDLMFENEKIGCLGRLNATTRARVVAALLVIDAPEPEEAPAPVRTDRAAGGYYFERIGQGPNPRCDLFDKHGGRIGELTDMSAAEKVVGILNMRT